MTQDEMQKIVMEAIASGKMKPSSIVLGDEVKYKINKVEPGAVVEQNNYYGRDGELLQQTSMEPMTEEDIDAAIRNASPTKVEPATPTDEDTDPHSNIKLRRELLKQSYEKLLETDFNQGSDWYYIYRMMEDNTIYTHDYKSFLDDLIAAEIDTSKINKSAFTNISKRIQKDPTFPNWKVIAGKQQKVIDRGIALARIAFNILFK